MDARYRSIAAQAATQHSVVSAQQIRAAGVSNSLRSKWQSSGLLEPIGHRSFAMPGSPPSWRRSLSAALLDLGGVGVVAGRSAARLMGLDGFDGDDLELLVPREFKNRPTSGILRSTIDPLPGTDVQRIDGLRVVRAERLILDSPRFGFSDRETENAIDSAIRLRLVSEQRLRTRVLAQHRQSINGSRTLLRALVDSGGESRLERWFLRLCRSAGLPRPRLQVTYRTDNRTIARVDAEFPGGLVVELLGHGTHSSRRQSQSDHQRTTELTLLGKRVISFTYNDIRDRPAWVVSVLRRALQMAA
jgi:hypothetical protein